MQETNIGDTVDDYFTVQLKQQAQNTVCTRVLRPHVEQYGLTL
jgi:hypothetical protein